jgi:hypothetical protein
MRNATQFPVCSLKFFGATLQLLDQVLDIALPCREVISSADRVNALLSLFIAQVLTPCSAAACFGTGLTTSLGLAGHRERLTANISKFFGAAIMGRAWKAVKRKKTEARSQEPEDGSQESQRLVVKINWSKPSRLIF